MSIASKRGVCLYCGHDHDKIMFHSLPKESEIVESLRQQLATTQRLLAEAADSALKHAGKYSDIVQAITDPENQPSQYGTVTLAFLDAAIAKAKRDELERECADVDKIFAAIGWGVERTRTEGGSLRVAELSNALRDMIAPGDNG